MERPAYRQEWLQSVGNRLTWQASEKNRVSFYADFQGFFNRGRGEFASPEAYGAQFNLSPQLLLQVLSSPITNRLLLEAGASYTGNRWPYPSPGDQERPEFAANIQRISRSWNSRPTFDITRSRTTASKTTNPPSPSGSLRPTSPDRITSRWGCSCRKVSRLQTLAQGQIVMSRMISSREYRIGSISLRRQFNIADCLILDSLSRIVGP